MHAHPLKKQKAWGEVNFRVKRFYALWRKCFKWQPCVSERFGHWSLKMQLSMLLCKLIHSLLYTVSRHFLACALFPITKTCAHAYINMRTPAYCLVSVCCCLMLQHICPRMVFTCQLPTPTHRRCYPSSWLSSHA